MLFLLSSSYPPYSFKAHICLKPGANVDLWPLYKASCFVLHHQSLLSFPLILAVTAYYTISSLQFTLHPILPLNLFSAHYIYLSPPLCPLCFLKSRYQLSSSLGASSPLFISTYMLILFLFHCSGGVMCAADYAGWWSTYRRWGCHWSLVHPGFISTVLNNAVYVCLCLCIP